jgi:hypothetical protein
MTLNAQYKKYLKDHPESKFTYEEWMKWFCENLTKSLRESGFTINKD